MSSPSNNDDTLTNQPPLSSDKEKDIQNNGEDEDDEEFGDFDGADFTTTATPVIETNGNSKSDDLNNNLLVFNAINISLRKIKINSNLLCIVLLVV